jgi:hypothetical protein
VNKRKQKFDYHHPHCPVCESEMIRSSYYDPICKNGCYRMHAGYGWIDYYLFGEHIARIWDDDFKFWDKRKIRKKVEYWREDDRYLIHLLSK